MRFKTTWILLVVTVVAAAYFFLIEQPRHKSEEQATSAERRMTSLRPDDVDTVRIERADGDFAFELGADGWLLTHPVSDLVEDVKVNTLVRAITGADIERRLPDVIDRRDFGLDEPAAVVTLTTRDRSVVTAVGDLTLTKTHCYVALVEAGVMSNEVLIAPAGIRRYALRTLYEFRDKRVVPHNTDAVTRFTLVSPRDEMTWFRALGGPWLTVVDGDTIPGDLNEVEAVLLELRGLRATEILQPDEAATANIGNPSGHVIVEAAQQAPQRITLGEKRGNSIAVVVEGRDRISIVNAAVLHLFDKRLDDLRDRRLVRFGLSAAATITIESDTGATSIKKIGDDWSYANATLGTIDRDLVLNFITVLQNLRFRQVWDQALPAAADFDVSHAPLRIAVFGGDGSVLDEFSAGEKRPGNVRYAYSRGLDRWGVVDDEALADLLGRFDGFRLQ